MKILICANNDVGLYNFRKDLIKKLIEMNNELHISLPYGRKVEGLKQIGCTFIDTKIDRRGINPLKDMILLVSYFFIMRKLKPDMVITYTIKPNIYAGIVCRLLNIKYVLNITGLGYVFQKESWLKKVLERAYFFICQKAHVVFFENISNKDVFLNLGIVNCSKTFVLKGAGVNTKEYKLALYPLDSVVTRFLFVGRIMQDKGIEELILAVKKLKMKYGDSVELDLVGLYEENYAKKIEQLVCEKIVNYHGFQDDVKPFINRAHCLVLPSYHEGMSNVLLEAAAMGRPLITTDIAGCREAVLDGQSGLLCKVRDAQDLYMKMQEFVELSYQSKRNMGLISHSYVTDNFNKDDVVEATIKMILKSRMI